MKSLEKKLPVQFTDNAIKEIKRLASLEQSNKILQIGVKNGGCSGFTYVFEFVEKPAQSDSIYQYDAISFYVEDEHISLINNLEIDYQDGLQNRGFTFTNPNAQETCGCGTSFA